MSTAKNSKRARKSLKKNTKSSAGSRRSLEPELLSESEIKGLKRHQAIFDLAYLAAKNYRVLASQRLTG